MIAAHRGQQPEREHAVLVVVVSANRDQVWPIAETLDPRRALGRDRCRAQAIDARVGDGDLGWVDELLVECLARRGTRKERDSIGERQRCPRQAPVVLPVSADGK